LPDTIIKRITINNLLHKDGTVNYYPNVLTHDDANHYFDLLLQKIVWENDEVIISVSISSQREKLHGMVILTTCIPIQIQQSKHYHGLKNF
jgi:hypothetical protein